MKTPTLPSTDHGTLDTTLRFLEIFRSDYYADVSLSQWLAFTPHELVRAHLNIDESLLKKVQNSPSHNPRQRAQLTQTLDHPTPTNNHPPTTQTQTSHAPTA